VSRYLSWRRPARLRNRSSRAKGKGKYVRQAIDVLIGEGFAVERRGRATAQQLSVSIPSRRGDRTVDAMTAFHFVPLRPHFVQSCDPLVPPFPLKGRDECDLGTSFEVTAVTDRDGSPRRAGVLRPMIGELVAEVGAS
jgi:hypothetical protein